MIKRNSPIQILVIVILIIGLAFGMTAIKSYSIKSSTTNAQENYASQPGSYFVPGEERFVLVDQSIQTIGGMKYTCRVFADKYMLTMYLWMSEFSGSGRSSLTQIFYEDGSPMIYDPTEEEWAEWER